MTCSVPDCTRPVEARGWCQTHYMQWRRTGDPVPKPPLSLAERLHRRIEVIGGCHLWTGKLNAYGYGMITISGGKKRQRRVHIVAYETLIGPVPEGLVLDHTCHLNNGSCAGGVTCLHRRCINPDHMMPRTIAENVMRGVGLMAKQARQTHCKRGHPLSGDNLYEWKGTRLCRTCRALNYANWQKRQEHSRR